MLCFTCSALEGCGILEGAYRDAGRGVLEGVLAVVLEGCGIFGEAAYTVLEGRGILKGACSVLEGCWAWRCGGGACSCFGGVWHFGGHLQCLGGMLGVAFWRRRLQLFWRVWHFWRSCLHCFGGVLEVFWRGVAFWRSRFAVFWRGANACSDLEGCGIMEKPANVLEGCGILEKPLWRGANACSDLEGRGILEKLACSCFGGVAFWRVLAVFWRGVKFLEGDCSALEGCGIFGACLQCFGGV